MRSLAPRTEKSAREVVQAMQKINLKTPIFDEFRRLFRFLMAGLVNTITSWLIFVFFYSFVGLSSLLSLVCSYAVAFAIYLPLIVRYVFSEILVRRKHVLGTCFLFVWPFLFQTVSLNFFDGRLNVSPNILVLLNLCFITPVNYLIASRLLFSRKGLTN